MDVVFAFIAILCLGGILGSFLSVILVKRLSVSKLEFLEKQKVISETILKDLKIDAQTLEVQNSELDKQVRLFESNYVRLEEQEKYAQHRLQAREIELQEIIHKQEEELKNLDQKQRTFESEFARIEEKELQIQNRLKDKDKQLQEIIQNHEKDLKNFDNYIKSFVKDSSRNMVETQEKKLEERSTKDISKIAKTFEDQIRIFKDTIHKTMENNSKEQSSLKDTVLKSVASMDKFANILKSGGTKVQGNWGEIVLEKILEESGLRKNTDYKTQGGGSLTLTHPESGKTQKPDVMVFLPENKHIIIDSKTSLISFENFHNAETDIEKQKYLKEFTQSINTHISSLEKSRYQDMNAVSSLDFVLMFIPIEAAYFMIMQYAPELHTKAWDKKIIIVCPSTLFATLRTVAQFWKVEEQRRNADKIAKIGTEIYGKIKLCIDDLNHVRKKFDSASDSYDSVCRRLFSGNGNLMQKARQLENHGISPSKRINNTENFDLEEDDEIEEEFCLEHEFTN